MRRLSLLLLSSLITATGCPGDEEVLPVELVKFELVGAATTWFGSATPSCSPGR